jgi:asparagine synthase (glutamine-hydrolysing)
MCGIFGIYNIGEGKIIRQQDFEEALLTMKHRGPDAHGVKAFDDTAILGHVRLSIIDLNEKSNQPFQLDNRYWIVFNGEIYNYLELKDELIATGYRFRTASDTEVLVRAYQHWGEQCVNRFNGMWAFVIYDEIEKNLFCSRDRFGIKPFNYTTISSQFVFSSEIKGIISYFPQLKLPNYNVIANYCRNSVGGQIRETWFESIYRLEPAHNLVVNAAGIKSYRYWDYPRKVNMKIPFKEAVVEYRQLLADAVNKRMRSDVPVGFTLSSGIDSTSLVCLLRNHFNDNKNTYTAAFTGTTFQRLEKQNFKDDIEIDEPSLVRRLTTELELKPTILEINYDDYVNVLKEIIHYMESGHGSPAVFPLFHILKEARKNVTVILEGQGADELLGGYINNVFPIYFLELIRQCRFRKAFTELKSFAKCYSLKAAFMLLIRQSKLAFLKKLYYYFSGIECLYSGEIKKYKEIRDYPLDPCGFDSLLNEHLYKAHTGGLVNLLHYGDAVSMAHSLESRLPFMDYRLVEFVFTLPSEFKVHLGMGKYLHRQAMEGIVPGYIINNPLKLGFESPLSHVFEKEDEKSAKAVLLSDKCLARGLFSKEALLKAFREHKQGKRNHSRFLYRMLSVELWFREFIDIEASANTYPAL